MLDRRQGLSRERVFNSHGTLHVACPFWTYGDITAPYCWALVSPRQLALLQLLPGGNLHGDVHETERERMTRGLKGYTDIDVWSFSVSSAIELSLPVSLHAPSLITDLLSPYRDDGVGHN